MKRRVATFVLAAGLVLGSTWGAVAETGAPAGEALALRSIMKGLGANMQVVTDGISREDWTLVAKTAPLIADHPQPPFTEKVRIMAFMGTNMGRFKGYDEETHKAAESLKESAVKGDGQAAIAAFQAVQTACYGCHRDFRKPFLEHFYGAR